MDFNKRQMDQFGRVCDHASDSKNLRFKNSAEGIVLGVSLGLRTSRQTKIPTDNL